QAAVRVFVTGGTGFVGAHLVRAVVARGDQVTCLVRTPTKAQALGWRGVRIVRGDLDDARALRDGAAGAEVVYHVAGRISARTAEEFMAANRDGTANLLEAAADAPPPPRFVPGPPPPAAGPAAPRLSLDAAPPA